MRHLTFGHEKKRPNMISFWNIVYSLEGVEKRMSLKTCIKVVKEDFIDPNLMKITYFWKLISMYLVSQLTKMCCDNDDEYHTNDKWGDC